MASSFTVTAEGRRVTVRVTPMQPLSAIVAAAAAALSPPVADPSTCVLRVNGKALSPAELGTPVRFANLSAATAKLELVTGRERGLGVAGGVVEKRSEEGLSTTAGPSSSSAAAAVPQQAGPPPPVPAVTLPPAAAGAAASAGEGPSSSPATAPPAAPAPAAAPTGAAAAAPPAAPPPVPRAVAAPAPSPAALLPPRAPLPPPPKPADPAVVIEASVRTHLSAPGGGVAGLGLEEASVAVFSRDDLERAAAAARGGVPLDALASPSSNPPDSFFEFTPEDYRAVLGSYRGGREAAAASAPLKTAQQRAAEAAARAAAAGDVRLRVHFSDRSILQFRLPATAPLGVLREVVSRALERRGSGGGGESGGGESGGGGGGGGGGGVGASTCSSNAPAHLAPWEWEIYTAPPKTVLKAADDARETLFSLGLSPAANIHCGPATASSSSAGAGAAKSSSTTTTTTMKEAPRLRPELLALRRSGVVPGAAEAEREEMEAKARGGGGGGSGAASASAAAGGSNNNNNNNNGKGKAGMPKWMKMGK